MAEEQQTVASRALGNGTETSEYQVAQDSAKSSRILTILGTVLGVLPTIMEGLNAMPDSLKNKAWFVILLTIFGGIMAILGITKETMTKVAYIQSRGIVKAAAIRDADVTTATPVDVPKL